jgi:hypothetical protein
MHVEWQGDHRLLGDDVKQDFERELTIATTQKIVHERARASVIRTPGEVPVPFGGRAAIHCQPSRIPSIIGLHQVNAK